MNGYPAHTGRTTTIPQGSSMASAVQGAQFNHNRAYGSAVQVLNNTGTVIVTGASETEESLCLAALRTSEYEEHKNRIPDRVEGTCQWFLNHARYLAWKNSPVSSILWVSADPGCGKSVLSKSLVDIDFKGGTSTVCYFFFREDNAEQRRIDFAAAALLHQLLNSKPVLLKYAIHEFRRNGNRFSSLFAVLWSILLAAAEDPDAGEIICVLDALDECEEHDRYQLIETLGRLFINSSKINSMKLKIIVTSRPYYQIQRRFRSLLALMPTIHLAGEEETKTISDEIDLVIKATIQKLQVELELSQSLRQFLEDKLVAIPHRTYLWLKLVFAVIREQLVLTRKTLRAAVDTIPETANKAYSAILDRSVDKEKAREILHIIVAATRPLTLKEMRIALAVGDMVQNPDELDIESLDTFRTTLRNICGLFVTVSDSKIYLIHQTAKEFLTGEGHENTQPGCLWGDWMYTFNATDSHSTLAKICILYLDMSSFRNVSPPSNGENELDSALGSLLYYASTNWVSHARKSVYMRDAMTDPILDNMKRICDPEDQSFGRWFRVYKAFPQGTDPPNESQLTPLDVSAYFGLVSLVKLLVASGADTKRSGPDGKTAICWAVERGHLETVRFLLTKCPDAEQKSDDGYTLLHRAALANQPELILLFLENGAKLDARTKDRDFSPLLSASWIGAERSAKTLLEAGADVSFCSSLERHQTALHEASYRGAVPVINLLLDWGADINKEDNLGETPLQWALNWNQDQAIEVLVKRGAEAVGKTRQGLEYWMAQRNIRHNADASNPNVHDDPDSGILRNFMYSGNIDAFQALLESGFDANSDLMTGKTALDIALEMGSAQMIAVILRSGGLPALVWNPESDSIKRWSELAWYPLLVHVLKSHLERGSTHILKAQASRNELVFVNSASPNEPYVRVVIPEDVKQVTQVIFVTESRDQGWSDSPEQFHGTYSLSNTWFDVGVSPTRNSDKENAPTNTHESYLQNNIHASRHFSIHTNIWNYQGSSDVQQWLQLLQPGDEILLIPRAKYAGWANIVRSGSIMVYSGK